MFKILSLLFVLLVIISNCVEAQMNGYRNNYPIRGNNNYPINWCECEYPRRYNRRYRGYSNYDNNDFNSARPMSTNSNFNNARPMTGNDNFNSVRSTYGNN